MPDDISSPAFAAPLRVLIVDDNPVVRAGLTALLSGRHDIRVVAEARDGRQAHQQTVQQRPDVVLLDVRMPCVDGLSALPHLVPLAPVLMMTYSREPGAIHEALRLGASGYLVHGEFTAEQLVTAVWDIRQGTPRFTRSASWAVSGGAAVKQSASAHMDQLVEPALMPLTTTEPWEVDASVGRHQFAPKPLLSQGCVAHSPQGRHESVPLYSELSQREVEIMDLIASGLTNQQIATACFISQKTVKNHINRIFAKLNAGSRGEAIARWNTIASGGSTVHG